MTFLEKISQVQKQINEKNTPEKNRELFHQLIVLNAYASYKGMESSEYDEKNQKKCEEYGRIYVDALGTYNDLTKQILDPAKVAKNKKKVSELCSNIRKERNKRIKEFCNENGKKYDKSDDAIDEKEYQLRAGIKGWIMSDDFYFLHYLYDLGRTSGNDAFRELADQALEINAANSAEREKFIDRAIATCKAHRGEVPFDSELSFLEERFCKNNKYSQERLDQVKERNKKYFDKNEAEFWKTHKIENGKIDFIREDDPQPDVDLNDEKVKQGFEAFKNKLVENGWVALDDAKENYEQMYRLLYLGSKKQTEMMKPIADELYNTKVPVNRQKSTQIGFQKKILEEFENYRNPHKLANEKNIKKVSELMALDAKTLGRAVENATKPLCTYDEFKQKLLDNGWTNREDFDGMYDLLFRGDEEQKTMMLPVATEMLETKLLGNAKKTGPIEFKEKILESVDEYKKLYAVDNKPMKLSTMMETSILTVRSFANAQKNQLENERAEEEAKKAKEELEFSTGINKIRRACEKLYAEPDFYQFWHRDTDEIIKLRSAAEKAWDVANVKTERKDSPEVRKNILEAYKKAVNYMSLKMIGADKDPFDNEQMESFKPGSGMGEKRWEGAKEIVEAIRTLYPEETAKLDADRLEINYKASVDKIADSIAEPTSA